MVTFQSLVSQVRRSRLCMVGITIVAWFLVSATLGLLNGLLDGFHQPWLVYVYNAFTIFSNLNDSLNMAMSAQGGDGVITINFAYMAISCALIISGMVGIAVLTASITSGTINVDEQRFDYLIDEFRQLTITATYDSQETGEAADPHRILRIILDRIHSEIVPTRTNTSMHQINLYEFEYIMINIINRIIEHRKLLHDTPERFLGYDLNKLRTIVAWAGNLDCLHALLEDSHPSPVVRELKHAWHNFSRQLIARVEHATEEYAPLLSWETMNEGGNYVRPTVC